MDYRQNIYRILIVIVIIFILAMFILSLFNYSNFPKYLKNCKECDGDIRGCAKQNITT